MKKIFALTSAIIFTLFVIISLFPERVHAAGITKTLSNGATFDLVANATSELDTIEVRSYASVTIKGAPGNSDVVRGVQIICYGGSKVTLENVNIDNSSFSDTCAIAFKNTVRSELILTGQNRLKSGAGQPGVQANTGVYLDIKGNGSLYAESGLDGAGIGSMPNMNCGAVTICEYVTVEALGLGGGAGIGGGYNGNGGTVNIKDYADVTAIGVGSGIGGGQKARGGHINISSGTVYARGKNGPGLGGNSDSASDPDEVVKITGGVVFATSDTLDPLDPRRDIGDIGNDRNNKLLEISGDAAVFLEHDLAYPNPTTTHRHLPVTFKKNGKIYNQEAPSEIYYSSAYLSGQLYLIRYNSNGGTPSTYYDVKYAGVSATLSSGLEFSMDHHYVKQWNTNPGGTGQAYTPGQNNTFTADVVLYAIWQSTIVESISFSHESYGLQLGRTLTLTPQIVPSDAVDLESVMWESTNPGVATVSNGVVTGVSVGRTIITASVAGKSAQCEVEVSVDLTGMSVQFGMYLNDIMHLFPLYTPENATYKEVTWVSSDENILEVDENGVASAVGLGNASITVTSQKDESIQCHYDISVIEKPITQVFFAPDEIQMDVGDTQKLSPFISPDNAAYDAVEWSSAPESVASVDDEGNVEAISPGDAAIYATIGGNTGMCTVTVIQPVETINLSLPPENIFVGDSFTLEGSVSPSNAVHTTITWTSTNTDAASVSQSGKVTALGTDSAYIRAECDGIYKEVLVEVINRSVAQITLDTNKLLMRLNQWHTLEPVIDPENATSKDVVWTTSAESVATVDKNGTVQSVGYGTCTITAWADGEKAECEVTVEKNAVTSVTFDTASKTLYVGDWFTLAATVSPADATYPDVTWESTNTFVATVTSNGTVEAVGDGSCVIKATADGVTAACDVSVGTKAVTGILLDCSSRTMYEGDIFALTATVSPDDAADPTVTWKSSDTSVATVTNGVVEAVGDGSCIITATAGGVSAACDVSVGTKAVTGISLDYSSCTMYEGGITALTATVSPDDAADPAVTWKSSNSSVATVTKSGVVTAVGTGTAVITASAGNESATCKITVNPEPEVEVSSVNISVDSVFTAVLYVGDTMMLSANVSPSDATDQSVTWQSSDSSIASVTSLGKVTAVSAGSVTITAAAQGKSATYSITVKAHEDPGASPAQTPAPAETHAPDDAPTPVIETVTETVVKEVILTVKLDTSALPEGTKYIKLPNGDIIELNGEEEISIIVPQDSLADDGTIEIVALDEGQVPLGSVAAEAEYIEVAAEIQEASAPVWKMIVMLLAGLAVGAVGTVIAIRYIIIRKRA